jgi:hypothetical protein
MTERSLAQIEFEKNLTHYIANHPTTPARPGTTYFDMLFWALKLRAEDKTSGIHTDPTGKSAAIGETAIELLKNSEYERSFLQWFMTTLLAREVIPSLGLGAKHTAQRKAAARGLTRGSFAGPEHAEHGRVQLIGTINVVREALERYFQAGKPGEMVLREAIANVNEAVLPRILVINSNPHIEHEILAKVAEAGRLLFNTIRQAIINPSGFPAALVDARKANSPLEVFAAAALGEAENIIDAKVKELGEKGLAQYVKDKEDFALQFAYQVRKGEVERSEFSLRLKSISPAEHEPITLDKENAILCEAENIIEAKVKEFGEEGLTEYIKNEGDFALQFAYQVRKGELERSEFVSLIKIMFTAGQGPITLGTETVMFKILRNPEILQRLTLEVTEASQSDKSFAEYIYRDNTLLKYVIETGLASAPPFLELYRQNKFSFAKLLRPADEFGKGVGGMVVANLAATALGLKMWGDDPLALQPDAFAAASPADKRFLIPFGSGDRVCIGFNVANLEMKAAIAILVLKLAAGEISFDAETIANNAFSYDKIHVHLERSPIIHYHGVQNEA